MTPRTVPVGIRTLVRDDHSAVSKPKQSGASDRSSLRPLPQISIWGIIRPGIKGTTDHHSATTGKKTRRKGGNKNKVEFVSVCWTYVVIGGFEMDRCEAVARDEVIF